MTVLYPLGTIPAGRVIVVGLGKREGFNVEAARRAAGKAAVKARELGSKIIATIVHGAGTGGLSAAEAAAATAEGTLLALYRYDAPRLKKEAKEQPERISLVELDESKVADMQAAVDEANAIAQGVFLARDLVNGPSNIVTPEYMAAAARELADTHGFEVTVGDSRWAEEQGMGAFLGVSMGTSREPAFIVLEHNPAGSTEAPIVLVGKGITFDTGGISLKPRAGMVAMISDMGGAAAVLGAMKAVGETGLKRRVIGIAACTENMPDGQAFRPGDVLTAANGKTIEITNTDAEGRLVLADALSYAQRFEPAAVVDLATLTGAVAVALGRDTAAGLYTNDDSLRDQFIAAGEATFERTWPLPLYPEFRKDMDSHVADLKNSSGNRFGGSSQAAAFLQEFVTYPWVHLDIAGMAYSSSSRDYAARGASGFGVRLLLEWLKRN